MKIKLFISFVTFLIVSALSPVKAYANTAGQSAVLTSSYATRTRDTRAEVLSKFLEARNSPLAPYAKSFVEEADRNNLDWKLVAAISGNESQFGELIPP